MNLTYIARINPQLQCTVFLEEEEWKVLYCAAANKIKNQHEKLYTIAEAITYICNVLIYGNL